MLYIKKISIVLICIFFLIGCKQYDNNKPVSDIQYTHENVQATITKLDVRYWFATCPRWHWVISVKYDDMTYTDEQQANGAFNRPFFIDYGLEEGDKISVEIKSKYVNGKLENKYISQINY